MSKRKRSTSPRVTLTKMEKSHIQKIAPTVSWAKQISGCAIRAKAAKEKRRRPGGNLVSYDFGLTDDDLQRMKESYE